MIGARAEGVQELVSGLDQAADELRTLDDAADEASRLVGARAARIAPRATGYLADHTFGAGGVITSTAPYAPAVHARDPFITKAIGDTETEVLAIYDRAVDQALDHART